MTSVLWIYSPWSCLLSSAFNILLLLRLSHDISLSWCKTTFVMEDCVSSSSAIKCPAFWRKCKKSETVITNQIHNDIGWKIFAQDSAFNLSNFICMKCVKLRFSWDCGEQQPLKIMQHQGEKTWLQVYINMPCYFPEHPKHPWVHCCCFVLSLSLSLFNTSDVKNVSGSTGRCCPVSKKVWE